MRMRTRRCGKTGGGVKFKIFEGYGVPAGTVVNSSAIMRNRILLTLCVVLVAVVCAARPPLPPATSAAAAPTTCDVDAYVVDPDPKGLNVRDAPGLGGKVVGTIPRDQDGTTVHVIASDSGGWVQINHAETIEGRIVFDRKGWVSGNMLGTGTRGYGGRGVKLYAGPSAKKVVGKLPS